MIGMTAMHHKNITGCQEKGGAKFRAWSVSPQGLLCSLLSAKKRRFAAQNHKETEGLGCLLGICPEFARNLPGICSEFARNSLGKRPRPAMRETLQKGLSFNLRGVAFMTALAVLTIFGGSGEHLALPLLVLQNTGQSGGFGGCSSYGGFGHDGYPA